MRISTGIPLALLSLWFAVAGCEGAGVSFDGFEMPDLMAAPDLTPVGGPTIDPMVISRSARSYAEAETNVAVAANGFVAVAYIAELITGTSNIGYRFSTDDGASWQMLTQLSSPGGRESSDPVVTADPNSNFYVVWIGFHRDAMGNPYDSHVYAATAPAGSVTFGDPVEVTDGINGDEYDKPWITVANDGAALATYAKTTTGGIFAARSSDGGKNWENAVIVEDRGFRNLAYPCLPSIGARVYVAYHAGRGIGLRWSDDHGASWPDVNKSSTNSMDEGRPSFEDPTCVADGSDVWVSYGLSQDQFTETSSAKLDLIRVAHSGDGGMTWDARYNAADIDAGQFFLLPALAREANGALDVVYYAGNSEGDKEGSFRRARSTDRGATWGTSVIVKSPLTFLGARDDAKWLGDYIGVTWARGNLYTAFADNALPTAHVAFYRTASP